MKAFWQIIQDMQRRGELPTKLTAAQLRALENSIRRYGDQVSEAMVKRILAEYHTSLASVLNPVQVTRPGETQTVTEGLTPADARAHLKTFLTTVGQQSLGQDAWLDFGIRTATSVANGAARHVRMNDAGVVQYWPAWELKRLYSREVPRGFRMSSKGKLIPVPDDDWPSRFRAACDEADDDKALQAFESSGRMIALKNSGVWMALGNGAGGYTDTLGNPFAPFAFNSGFNLVNIPRPLCVELGLLEEDEQPVPAKIDLGKLFGVVT